MSLIKCTECGNEVSDKAANCPHCGAPIDTKIHCPNCGSTDVSKISGLQKSASAWAFGIFAANTIMSKYKCNKCGNKF